MSTTPLSPAHVSEALSQLPDWQLVDNALVRTILFRDFRAAMAFLVSAAFVAESMNHHAEIYNVYNKVTLRLTTHDAGDVVTELDVQFARAISSLLVA